MKASMLLTLTMLIVLLNPAVRLVNLDDIGIARALAKRRAREAVPRPIPASHDAALPLPNDGSFRRKVARGCARWQTELRLDGKQLAGPRLLVNPDAPSSMKTFMAVSLALSRFTTSKYHQS
jgi:hypothetical protein